MNALEWTKELIKDETVSPSNNEETVLKKIGSELKKAGFLVQYDRYDPDMPGRCSLYARLNKNASGSVLLFGGHIDTVPLGTIPWSHPPFSGEINNGFLYGRGSCDMKSGIGGMLSACISMADKLKGHDLAIQIYGGEETGNLGSSHLAQNSDIFKNVAAAVICEPTGCKPKLGHRGCLWLKAQSNGKTAHASMPDQGDNALCKLISGLSSLIHFNFKEEHPVLGKSSIVLSTMKAGLNINSVPDHAEATIDIRCVPGQTVDGMIKTLSEVAGSEVDISAIRMINPVWTNPTCLFVKKVFSIFGEETKAEPVAFFTDASSLKSAIQDLPIVILGPGCTEMAHKTNEKCSIDDIEYMEDIYRKIISSFYCL